MDQIHVEFGPCPIEKPLPCENILEEEDLQEIDIVSGRLYFGQHGSEVKHMFYMLPSSNESMKDITYELTQNWQMFLPKIVVFVIHSSSEMKSVSQLKIKEIILKGLVNALNTTDMWLCLDGLDYGLSKEIGVAFQKEIWRRKHFSKGFFQYPKTALLGICPLDVLKFADKLHVCQKDEDEKEEAKKYGVSRDFDKFIFVKNCDATSKSFVAFELKLAKHLKQNLHFKRTMRVERAEIFSEDNVCETPVIALLIKGSLEDVDIVLGHLKHEVPVVVVEGSGGLADLLAFAYNLFTCRPYGVSIADYNESVLKPQVWNKLNELFPPETSSMVTKGRFLREKICDCIQRSSTQDQVFLTLISRQDMEDESMHLTTHLFKAIYNTNPSGKAKTQDSDYWKKYLFLAMDWNCPDVAPNLFSLEANKELLHRPEAFFRALIMPQREEFVSIFLKHGFLVHRFLDTEILIKLFENSLGKDYFKTVIWENMLEFSPTDKIEIPMLFMNKLVKLLENFTGVPALIKPRHLKWNYHAHYSVRTPKQAERESLLVLCLWGILSNRFELVKTIWKHSEQPVRIALTCSVILDKLQIHVSDLHLQNEMKKNSVEFNEMAIGVMDEAYKMFPNKAMDMLCLKDPIWGEKPLIEIAYFAQNRDFIAHPCCQEYLDKKFMGKIKFQELPFGDLTIPVWLKVIMSNFLIFPMFLWIEFKEEKGNRKHSSKEISFPKKLYYLYTAPISKFWNFQMFYLAFLFLYGLAVIWPSCGNRYLDFLCSLWIAVIIIDSTCDTILATCKYRNKSMLSKWIQIALITLFWITYFLYRVLYIKIMLSEFRMKVIMILALLFFYYRFLFLAFPISPKLGPLLFMMLEMTLVDFASFMRVTILVVISNAIVIHSTIYPDYPLGWDLLRKSFHDGLIAFFLIPDEHIGEPDMTCVRLKRHPNKISFIGLPDDVCKVGRYYLPECPNPGIWPAIFGLQYFLLLRLVLLTLLMVLFSSTQMRFLPEGTKIWKYQRCELVSNFYDRAPVPFSSISLLITFTKRFLSRKNLKEGLDKQQERDDETYWKILAANYLESKRTVKGKNDKENMKKRLKKLLVLTQAISKQRKQMTDIMAELGELQIHVGNTNKHIGEGIMEVTLIERFRSMKVRQVCSRMSPYPGTTISRVLVPDNFVSWEVPWKSYDPVTYIKPRNSFSADIRVHVDEDIQRNWDMEDFQLPVFNWNTQYVTPSGMSIDRLTWITDQNGTPIPYELYSDGLPRNPCGRTGISGKGSLPRWGPNHYIYVVISQSPKDFQMRQNLEVVLCTTDSGFSLPGGSVFTENKYSVIHELFESENVWEDLEMVDYFETLSKSDSSDDQPTQGSRQDVREKFTYERVKKGYLDESTNTDQAWCEAEIWHFHYSGSNKVKEKLKENLRFILLTEEVLEKLPQGQAYILFSLSKTRKASLVLKKN